MEPNHRRNLAKFFQSLDLKTKKVGARENSNIEFKESFNWAAKSSYAKAMAAFCNNNGGYLIFGITNSPKVLVGLNSANFENQDEATITTYLNSLFSPEIQYEKFTKDISGLKIGFFYIHESDRKPVIAIKNDGDVREAEIYYRYSARNDRMKYPEMKNLFDKTREEEKKNWMQLFAKVAKIGPSNTGVMNLVQGTIEGSKSSLLIDRSLVSKLKFIKEGQFSEKGKPTLKLVGDVRPVMVSGYRASQGSLRITDDLSAPAVREETILRNYPFDYPSLARLLRKRYKNFVINSHFHRIRETLVQNPRYCRTRYLDPKNQTGTRKKFYSDSIIAEFDKYYEKKT